MTSGVAENPTLVLDAVRLEGNATARCGTLAVELLGLGGTAPTDGLRLGYADCRKVFRLAAATLGNMSVLLPLVAVVTSVANWVWICGAVKVLETMLVGVVLPRAVATVAGMLM